MNTEFCIPIEYNFPLNFIVNRKCSVRDSKKNILQFLIDAQIIRVEYYVNKVWVLQKTWSEESISPQMWINVSRWSQNEGEYSICNTHTHTHFITKIVEIFWIIFIWLSLVTIFQLFCSKCFLKSLSRWACLVFLNNIESNNTKRTIVGLMNVLFCWDTSTHIDGIIFMNVCFYVFNIVWNTYVYILDGLN